jgi:hypothetical protein
MILVVSAKRISRANIKCKIDSLLRQIFVVEFACGLGIERFRVCSGPL